MRLTDSLLSKIHFKKGPSGDIAYVNGKLKLKGHDNENEVETDTVIAPEKSIFLNKFCFVFNYMIKYMLFFF